MVRKKFHKKVTFYLLAIALIFSAVAYAGEKTNFAIDISISSAYHVKKYNEFFRYFEPIDMLFFNYLMLTVAFNTIVGLFLIVNYRSSVALFGKLLLIPGNLMAILAFYLREKLGKR